MNSCIVQPVSFNLNDENLKGPGNNSIAKERLTSEDTYMVVTTSGSLSSRSVGDTVA